MAEKGGGNGVECCTGGGNGGVVVGKRSGGTDDGSPAKKAVGCGDEGRGGGGRRDSGEGGGRTKDVGSSDVGTVEGMTSVSKDASTRLLDIRLGREPGRFADAEALEAFGAFRGDLCTSFGFDFERVFRGDDRRDGPGCATAGGGTRFSGRVEGSISRFFFELCCSSSCSCFDYEW